MDADNVIGLIGERRKGDHMSFLWKLIRDTSHMLRLKGIKLETNQVGMGLGVENVYLFLRYSKVVVIPFPHVAKGHMLSWRLSSMVLLIG